MARRTEAASLLILLFLLAVGYFFASPYVMLFRLWSAIRSGDTDVMSSLIDFPKLRESVRDQFKIQMNKEFQKKAVEMADNPFAGLGMMIGVSMVNNMADQIATTYISPSGLHELMPEIKSDPKESSEIKDRLSFWKSPFWDGKQAFKGLSTFIVDIPLPELTDATLLSKNKAIKLKLQRSWISWKVAEAEIPFDYISKLGGRVKSEAEKLNQKPGSEAAASPELSPSPEASTKVDIWEVTEDSSPIDDSKRVTLYRSADQNVVRSFGREFKPILFIRCKENRTELFIVFDQYLGYEQVQVTTRIDKERAATSNWSLSTDSKGIFAPGSHIQWVKKLLGKEQLLVQLTPSHESPIMVTFQLRGLEEVIGKVQSACNWK